MNRIGHLCLLIHTHRISILRHRPVSFPTFSHQNIRVIPTSYFAVILENSMKQRSLFLVWLCANDRYDVPMFINCTYHIISSSYHRFSCMVIHTGEILDGQHGLKNINWLLRNLQSKRTHFSRFIFDNADPHKESNYKLSFNINIKLQRKGSVT